MCNLERLKRIYNPYKIYLKNNVTILESSTGKFVLKKGKKDLFTLYGYLESRGINNFPKIINAFDNNEYLMDYVDSSFIPLEQYYLEFAKELSNLHYKTQYERNISHNEIEKIYDSIDSNITYYQETYQNLFKSLLLKEYLHPAEYLFCRNYSIINRSLNYSKSILNDWHELYKDLKKERICLIHNNLSKDHFIISENKNTFISFDNYRFDIPIFDLVAVFKNTIDDMCFDTFFKYYDNNFKLNDFEKKLLLVIINMPYEIKDDKNILEFQKLFNYLNTANDLVASLNDNKESL